MIISELHDALTRREPVVMATVIDSDQSVPRRAGSKMLVYPDGAISGSVGGGEMESRVIAESLDALATGHPRKLSYELIDPGVGDPGVCGGIVELYIEPHLPRTRLAVVGTGEPTAAVVELAEWLSFDAVAYADGGDAELESDGYTTVIIMDEAAASIATPREDALAILANVIAAGRAPVEGN
jgi:xanthine/CO dehydrogenase XdhC/CoxF family maturation factor